MERTKTDMVLGTTQSNPGWQERAKDLCNPDLWLVNLVPKVALWESLSKEERSRLEPKIKMVEEAAKFMLAGMVKGTIKYPNDSYNIQQWMDHLIAEGADQMNYQILLATAFKNGIR